MLRHLLILSLCFLSFTNTGFAGLLKSYKGKIKAGRYYSPDGSYSCERPTHIGKQEIVDNKDGNFSFVLFQDEFGILNRLEILSIISKKDWAAASEKFSPEQMLPTFFEKVMLPALRTSVPEAKILMQEMVNLEEIPACFVLVDFPGSSVLVDAVTKERRNSKRGFLLFMYEGDVVVSSFQSDMTCNSPVLVNDIEGIKTIYLNDLLKFAGTIKFEQPTNHFANKRFERMQKQKQRA